MKKTIKSVFAILLAGSLVFIACKKEKNQAPIQEINTSSTTQNNGNVVRQIKSLSVNFIKTTSTPDVSNTSNKPGFLTILKVAVADVVGFLEGYNSLPNAPNGVKVIVGTIEGAAASIKEAKGAGLTISPLNVIPNTTCPNNNMEICGVWHYESTNAAAVDPNNYTANGVFSNTNSSNFLVNYMITNQHASPDFLQIVPQSDLISYMNETDALVGLSNHDLLQTFKNSGKIGNDAADILESYLDCLLSTTNPSDFTSYSLSVENIVSTSELPEEDKATCLGAMATARHGVLYWNAQQQ